jgi:hypothetical protein
MVSYFLEWILTAFRGIHEFLTVESHPDVCPLYSFLEEVIALIRISRRPSNDLNMLKIWPTLLKT